jgi:hypothetical protein
VYNENTETSTFIRKDDSTGLAIIVFMFSISLSSCHDISGLNSLPLILWYAILYTQPCGPRLLSCCIETPRLLHPVV